MNAAKNINYAELVEFIGDKFEVVGENFKFIDEKFERSNLAIESIQNDLGGQIKEMRGEVRELKGMFNRLQTSVDKKTYHDKTASQEITMINSQIKRHDRWIHKVAGKVKIDLSPN